MIKKIFKKVLQPILGKKEYFNVWSKIYWLSLEGQNIGRGGDYATSGELYVMHILQKLFKHNNEIIIFDVGANIGGYTQELRNHFASAYIHCFEPANKTFIKLVNNLSSYSKIKLNNCGIGDTQSEAILYYNENDIGLTSLYNRECVNYTATETIKVDTLDHYCNENEIERIDFLKMDIEGNELNALHGAQNLIRNGRISVIQIEFGGCNIDSRTFFRDFWNLLTPTYSVYRVMKNGLLEIEEYKETLELFVTTNYIFINKNLKNKGK